MAANFWRSSHAEQWIFDKKEIARMHAEDFKIYTEEEYAKFHIFWANLITSIATETTHQSSRPSSSTGTGNRVRQQVIATAAMYFKRFYTKRSFKDMDPYLVASTSLFLACKVEEHTNLSVSTLLKNCAVVMHKRWGIPFDANLSKNADIYESEFILVEMLDCCLIVYHPNRPLNLLLTDMNKALQPKEFELVEAQCHKVCNDSIRCDVGLQFAPHCIALACIMVGTELMGRGEEFLSYFCDITTDIDKLIDCTEQIYQMYKLWKEFDEKEQVKILIAKLPRINSIPVMMAPIMQSSDYMNMSVERKY